MHIINFYISSLLNIFKLYCFFPTRIPFANFTINNAKKPNFFFKSAFCRWPANIIMTIIQISYHASIYCNSWVMVILNRPLCVQAFNIYDQQILYFFKRQDYLSICFHRVFFCFWVGGMKKVLKKEWFFSFFFFFCCSMLAFCMISLQ